jgi:hypothetical protein
MKFNPCFAVVISFLTLSFWATAQTSPLNSETTSASVQVPRVIRFSGIAKDETGKALSGVLGITFALYHDEQGGAPLWLETQNVQADAAGHYTALFIAGLEAVMSNRTIGPFARRMACRPLGMKFFTGCSQLRALPIAELREVARIAFASGDGTS